MTEWSSSNIDAWGQGNSAIGDFSARVPLFIFDPRRDGQGQNKRVVRTVDLAPTLLELVELPVPEQMQGVSLVPALEDPETQLELAAFFETGTWLTTQPGTHPGHLIFPDILELLEVNSKKEGTLVIKPRYEGIVIEARDRMIRASNWLLVYLPLKQGAIYKLFNIQDDPQCLHEVSKLHPDILVSLKQQLVAWLKEDGEREWKNEHLVTHSSVTGREGEGARILEERFNVVIMAEQRQSCI
jgi:hypothetical protein